MIACGYLRLTLTFTWKGKKGGGRGEEPKTILKKNQVKGFTSPDSRLTKATLIKTSWYWQKDRHRSKQNLHPGINPRKCGQLTSDKGAKEIQQRRNTLCNRQY